MFSISKPFKVKSWRQSDCRHAPCSRLTLPLRVFAGLQVPHLTLPSTGIYFWKRYVVSLCVNFSYAMYLRYFPMKSKVWLRGNFSPPNYRLELWRWTGFPTSSTLCLRCVHVVSTFGLVAGLLRNKKIPDELINSAGFMAIVNLVNSATLNFESEGAKNLSFGAKTSQDSEELVSLLAERSARINSLEVELKSL